MLPYYNTQLKHWNPGAKNPLILPVHVICNTSDEQLYSNIKENSHGRGRWLRVSPSHHTVAVICGSGPSLADTLDDVRRLQREGGTVFALNGAAKFLADHGIEPDIQVIIDARPETADLIGPAQRHLFASQVSPECFNRMPSAELWHLQIENIDDYLPDYPDPFVMIGGAASVGNTTTCLAYAMGHRKLELFGYDSSHRDGKGHAFHQKMNDGDPCAWVQFAGKHYLASITMKLQAEKFQNTAADLKKLGCEITVNGSGLLPAMYNTPNEMGEREKYERMWLLDDYRTVAPGERCVDLFRVVANPRGRIIDLGCGTGRGGLRLFNFGHEVLLTDFAGNCLDPEALHLPFLNHDLTLPFPEKAPYGFCTDVMEHIPGDQVDLVLKNIFDACDNVFFQIALYDDEHGKAIDQHLHLSVHPAEWWIMKLETYGRVEWMDKSLLTILVYVTRRQNATG